MFMLLQERGTNSAVAALCVVCGSVMWVDEMDESSQWKNIKMDIAFA